MRVLATAFAVFAGSALCTANAQFSTAGIPQKPQPTKQLGKRAPAKTRTGAPAVRGGGILALVGGSDSCTTPDPIAGQGSFPYDLTTATTGAEGQTEGLCYFFATSGIDNDVWFAWTADATGSANVSTCGDSADTKIAAYPGSGCPVSGTALACNDDACGLQSSILFGVTAGTTYTLQVGTFPGATGATGNLTITIVPPVGPEDNCATPIGIAGQGSFPFNLAGATTGIEGQAEGLCYFFGTTGIDSDIWYSWTADASGTGVIGTCTSSVDTKIAVYPGSPSCPVAGTALACNDDACGLQTTVALSVTAGTTYTIQLGTFPGASQGSGNMDISILPPVTNDDCNTPTAIAGQGTFPFNLLGATTGTEGQTEGLCYFFGSTTIDSDVWYSWTADATGTASISTCTSTVDTKIAAYPATPACPTAGSALACNDDACGFQTTVAFPCTSGTTYTLQVGTFPGAAQGSGNMDIVILPPVLNDDCNSPTAIAGQGNFSFNLLGATTGIEGQAEGLCYAFGSSGIDSDVWYSWTADADGLAIVATCNNTTVDTKIAAYPGTPSCPTIGSALACNDDACGFQSTVVFEVMNGTSYTLQVGTFPGAGQGSGSFDISIVPAPSCYTYDLGASDNAVGLTAGGDLIIMNGFTAGTGADTITEISATFGTPLFPGGYVPGNITWAIWDDPTNDFDPSDAVLLYSAPDVANAASVDTDVFQTHAVPNVPVTDVFFVGVMFDNHAAGEFPGSLEQTIPSLGRAWVAGDTTGNGDLTNLLLNDVPPLEMGSIGIDGVWMLRAVGPNCGLTTVGTGYCFGDGTGAVCPCANFGGPGEGCANSTGAGSKLVGTGSASVSAANLVLSGSNLEPNQPGLYFQGLNSVNGGLGVPFGDGLRCAGGGVVRLQVRVADSNGNSATTIDLVAKGGVSAGDVRRYQLWYRNPNNPIGSPCGTGFNLSNGLEITWAP